MSAWLGKLERELQAPSSACGPLLDSARSLLGEVARVLQEPLACEGIATQPPAVEPERRQVGAGVAREHGLLFEAVLECAREHGGELGVGDVLELARQLNRASAQAVDANQELDRRDHAAFVAFLAHEIRNSLFTARIAWETGANSGECHGKSWDRVGHSLSRLTELVENAVAHSRLKLVGMGDQLHREVLSIERLLGDAVEDSLPHAEQGKVRLRIEGRFDLCLWGDARLLRSALANLTRNAVKFTRRGGEVVLRSSVRDGLIRIEIDDECGGLRQECAERLFGPFVQANAERSGFGLGLAIVREAVQAHGGTVSVADHPEHGCTFAIELPGACAA